MTDAERVKALQDACHAAYLEFPSACNRSVLAVLRSMQKPGAALAPDPERRERVYVGTLDGRLFTSANRGKTWEPLAVPLLPAIRHLFVLRLG